MADNVASVMAALDEVGWFNERTDDDRARVKKELEKLEFMDAGDVACALADFAFDTECIDGNPGDYADLVKEFGKAARGAFQLDDVADAFSDGTASISFRVGETPYSLTVPFESDWFDSQVAELLDKVAETHGDARRFVLLPVLDQIAYVTFVDPKVVDRLMELGVLKSFQDLAAEQM